MGSLHRHRVHRRSAILVVAFAAIGTLAIAQSQPGVHPVSGRQYALPMGVQGAAWLDRPERVEEEDPDTALRILKIVKGTSVADIGAGSGYMTIRLAKIVGPTGRVYANDIQSGMLDLLQKNVSRARLMNVIPVLGAVDERPRDGDLGT